MDLAVDRPAEGNPAAPAGPVASQPDARADAPRHDPTAAKRPWVLSLARGYARRAVTRRFDGLFVHGLDDVVRLAAQRPLLLCANHVCWWDTFALVLVDEALGTDGYALMDAVNLARLPFFRLIGAVPLDVEGGARSRRQLDDAARTLCRPGRTMWIFPQGRQRAAHVRPLGFKPGLRLVAARAARHGAVVVPVGLAYPWRESSSPSIALRFGEAIDPATTTRGDLTALVEQRVAALVDDIHAGVDADARVAPGRPLVPPTRSNTEDGVGARVLRRLLGGTR